MEGKNVFTASISESITAGSDNTQEEAIHSKSTENPNPSTSKLSKTTNVSRAPQNRKRKIAGNENISTINAAIGKLDEVVTRNKSNDDEFDIFGKHIAVQLKQMPLYDAIICQEQIQNVIRQKRLQLLMRQPEYRTNPSSAFSPPEFQTTPPPAFSPSQYHSSPSPAFSNNRDGEYWSSSISTQSGIQQCEEDSQESSDMLTTALTGVLD